MPQASTPILNSFARHGAVVLVPGEKFFIRRVPLAPEGDATAQVGLALEGLSPFPAGQLYFGFRPDAARTSALVFAAYRKNFTAEETAGWDGAAAVLPDFAIWLSAGAAPAAGLWVREQEGRVEVAAFDGRSALPAALLVRRTGAAGRDALVAKARRQACLPAGAPVKILLSSPIETVREKRELVVRLAGGEAAARFGEAALGQADVRDKALLTEHRQTHRRDTLLWRGFAATLGGLAACLALELGLLAMRGWLGVRLKEINDRKAAVEQIDLAQSLAKKLEDLSAQRLLPFEMLDAVNNKRPKSVEFTRVSTNGQWRMDIEAQTTNAGDLPEFVAEVRRLAGIEHLELRDQRLREGQTTFLLEVTFKPGWLNAAPSPAPSTGDSTRGLPSPAGAGQRQMRQTKRRPNSSGETPQQAAGNILAFKAGGGA
jgi:hypothetical protein